jgi:hypothetical protein
MATHFKLRLHVKSPVKGVARFDPLGFEKLINFGIGKTRVGPEINARDLPLVAFDNRLQHTVPSVGAVDVAGTKRTSFQVTELVEHEERMVAAGAK